MEAPWLDLTPGPVPRAWRLASAAGLPVGLWVLWCRLSDPDPSLSDAARHWIQGGVCLIATVAGLLIAGRGDLHAAAFSRQGAQLGPLAGGLACSALSGWWFLRPGGPRGLWRGVVCYGRALLWTLGSVLGCVVLVAFPPLLACKLAGWDPPPAWMTPWFDVVVPTLTLLCCTLAPWIAADEAESGRQPTGEPVD